MSTWIPWRVAEIKKPRKRKSMHKKIENPTHYRPFDNEPICTIEHSFVHFFTKLRARRFIVLGFRYLVANCFENMEENFPVFTSWQWLVRLDWPTI